jgi:hypothetical protein
LALSEKSALCRSQIGARNRNDHARIAKPALDLVEDLLILVEAHQERAELAAFDGRLRAFAVRSDSTSDFRSHGA